MLAARSPGVPGSCDAFYVMRLASEVCGEDLPAGGKGAAGRSDLSAGGEPGGKLLLRMPAFRVREEGLRQESVLKTSMS